MRVSALSKACFECKEVCCGVRMPAYFLPGEIKKLMLDENKKHFAIDRKIQIAATKRPCYFFKKPICQIYKTRPIDCRTYPVSITLTKGKVSFVIDMDCHAVKMGLITSDFIKKAVKIWKSKKISKEWIKAYSNEEVSDSGTYKWIPIEKYMNHK